MGITSLILLIALFYLSFSLDMHTCITLLKVPGVYLCWYIIQRFRQEANKQFFDIIFYSLHQHSSKHQESLLLLLFLVGQATRVTTIIQSPTRIWRWPTRRLWTVLTHLRLLGLYLLLLLCMLLLCCLLRWRGCTTRTPQVMCILTSLLLLLGRSNNWTGWYTCRHGNKRSTACSGRSGYRNRSSWTVGRWCRSVGSSSKHNIIIEKKTDIVSIYIKNILKHKQYT